MLNSLKLCLLLLTIITVNTANSKQYDKTYDADIVIYGGTPAGISTAVAAAREGLSALIVEPSYIIGGMISGGLVRSDTGDIRTVGGLAKEFVQEINSYYLEKYGEDSHDYKLSRGGIIFEPSVAEDVFEAFVSEHDITVLRRERIDSVMSNKHKIRSFITQNYTNGERTKFTAKIFVDATYEGDLMAKSQVSYVVGREGSKEYHESLAGMNTGAEQHLGRSDHRVQAYNIRGTLTNKEGNVAPIERPKYYEPEAFAHLKKRALDSNAQRLVDIYPALDPITYRGYGYGGVNGKFDVNSADYAEINVTYAEANSEQRHEIYERVRDYWLSQFYLLQNDTELPEAFREDAKQWGLPKDEFLESNHITPYIYVRVARRMLGRYFMTQNDLTHNRFKEDSICIGSFKMDSHVVQQQRDKNGDIKYEGWFLEYTPPYEIPYRAITPNSLENLFVVCAVSASHVAYGSIRMEPVFMMMGQAVAYASKQAISQHIPIQDISIDALQAKLKEANIPLDAPYRPVVEITPNYQQVLKGEPVQFAVNVIHTEAPIVKYWWNFDSTGEVQSQDEKPKIVFDTEKHYTISLLAEDANGVRSYVDELTLKVGNAKIKDEVAILTEKNDPPTRKFGYWRDTRDGWDHYADIFAWQDEGRDKGNKTAVFVADIKHPGYYDIEFSYGGGPAYANNVPVDVQHSDGTTTVEVDQSKLTIFKRNNLGTFKFEKPGRYQVKVRTDGTKGRVGIREVAWVYDQPLASK